MSKEVETDTEALTSPPQIDGDFFIELFKDFFSADLPEGPKSKAKRLKSSLRGKRGLDLNKDQSLFNFKIDTKIIGEKSEVSYLVRLNNEDSPSLEIKLMRRPVHSASSFKLFHTKLTITIFLYNTANTDLVEFYEFLKAKFSPDFSIKEERNREGPKTLVVEESN